MKYYAWIYEVSGIEARALCVPGKHLPSEFHLRPPSSNYIYINFVIIVCMCYEVEHVCATECMWGSEDNFVS